MATLFKRNDIWYVNYSLLGRQYRISTGTAYRKLAEVALKEIELKLFRGEFNSIANCSDTKIRTVFSEYLSFLQENRTVGYTNHVRWHIKCWSDFFHIHHISSIQAISPHLAEIFLSTELTGRSGKTKREYLASLKGALNRAVKLGRLSANPIASVANPPISVKKVKFISKEEISQILEFAPNDLATAIKILVNTGMRLGELWALRWEDVDFSSRQLLIRAYDGFTPKGRRNRSIPMNQACLDEVNHLSSIRNTNDVYVYRMTCNATRLSNKFGKYVRKIGMKIRLHDLRHTFASHLVMSGTPLPVVQELLGHAHITTTMIYSHLAPNIHRREVEKLSF